MDQPRTGKLSRQFLVAAMALVPFLYLVFMVARYHVDVPWLDQWDLIPMLEKSFQGTLSFHDLWVPHNEHRIFFPRIVIIVLAHLSGWNIGYELATSILLGVGLFLALCCQIKATAKSIGQHGIGWVMPITSLLVFSLNQRVNWFMGIQIVIFMTMFAATAGLLLLANPVFKWTRFVAALLLGIVATYSVGNGVLYWFIGVPVLLAIPPADRRTRVMSRAVWIAIGLVAIGLYLYGYQTPSYHPSLGSFLQQPLEFVYYVGIFLGVPLVIFARIYAFAASMLGLGVLCGASWVLVRYRQVKPQVLVPYLAISLYSIGSGVLAGVTRVGLGTRQALTSRYATLSTPFWVSVVVLLYLLASSSNLRLKPIQGKLLRALAVVAMLTIVLLSVYGSALNSSIVVRDYPGWMEARNALYSATDDDLLIRLYWDPAVLRERLVVLRRYHLSVFRDQPR